MDMKAMGQGLASDVMEASTSSQRVAPTSRRKTTGLIVTAVGVVTALVVVAVWKHGANKDAHADSQSKADRTSASGMPGAANDPVTSFGEFVAKFNDAASRRAQADKSAGRMSYSFDSQRMSVDVTKSDSLMSPYLGTLRTVVWDGFSTHQTQVQFQLKGSAWALFNVTSSTEVSENQKIGTKRVAGIDVDDYATVKRTKDDSGDMRMAVEEVIRRIGKSP